MVLIRNTSLEVPLSINGSTTVYTTEKAGEQPLARIEKLTKVSQQYFEVQPTPYKIPITGYQPTPYKLPNNGNQPTPYILPIIDKKHPTPYTFPNIGKNILTTPQTTATLPLEQHPTEQRTSPKKVGLQTKQLEEPGNNDGDEDGGNGDDAYYNREEEVTVRTGKEPILLVIYMYSVLFINSKTETNPTTVTTTTNQHKDIGTQCGETSAVTGI